MINLVSRDEREAVVDSAADRLSFLVLAYGLLLLVAVRAYNGQQSWELLGLVVAGGVVGLLYRLRERAVSRPWSLVLLGTVVAAAAVAAVIGLLQLPR